MAEEEKELSVEGQESADDDAVRVQDTETIEKALEEEREKAEKYLANWQRAEADLINSKKRGEQERAELANFANATLVLALLPVLDDLERALENVPDELGGSTWVDGIRLIYRKMQAVLEAQGLSPIDAEGKDFDPNFHEAIMCVEGEEGMVCEEVQKGYRFRDRLLRPAKVKVGKSGEDSESIEDQE